MNRIESIYEGFKDIEKEWKQLEYIGELTLKRLNVKQIEQNVKQDCFIPKGSYKEYPEDAP